MGELRSALEIALRKAERLGKLSPEERLRQQAQRWKDTADAFVRPYLEGVAYATLDSLPEAASAEDQRERAAAFACSLLELLAGPLRIEEQMLPRIKALSENMERFAPGEAAVVRAAYDETRRSLCGRACLIREFEGKALDALRERGLSGSAILRVDAEALPDLRKRSEELEQEYSAAVRMLLQSVQPHSITAP